MCSFNYSLLRSSYLSPLVLSLQRDYAPEYQTIPPHGRWQHFDVGGRPRVDQMIQTWPSSVDAAEQTRRLIDLFLVSVLLDAGAGTKWQYKSKDNGKIYRRSEGLAVASLDMFKEGLFSSNPEQKEQVDGEIFCGLILLSFLFEVYFRNGISLIF